ncbi:hypothetical protein [Pseudonocardia sp. N23]|uniref:hypothetical protein n=1 Tax=Pseudonocardia sp. N23 TaxID=1987376 RepID=UPI000BFE740F|nr:hypothetical protein [Pseudonocardia sp. N23]GAY12058.1 hypothetical protein TOK_0448 [Pseudonocardia sp. N23]
MPDSTLDVLAVEAYANGDDPIDYAAMRVEVLLDVRGRLQCRDRMGRPPLPSWPDLSDAALARKVLGTMLALGWTPPSRPYTGGRRG